MVGLIKSRYLYSDHKLKWLNSLTRNSVRGPQLDMGDGRLRVGFLDNGNTYHNMGIMINNLLNAIEYARSLVSISLPEVTLGLG